MAMWIVAAALTEFRLELIENIQRVEQHLCEMEEQERVERNKA
jgi:hypothetical protein